MSIESAFRERLRAAIKESKISIPKLAEYSGVSARTIENWTKVVPTTPKVTDATFVAMALGVSVEFLVTGEKKYHPPLKLEGIVRDLLSLEDDDFKTAKDSISALSLQSSQKRILQREALG